MYSNFIPIVYLPYKIIIWNKLRHTLNGSLKCGFHFPHGKKLKKTQTYIRKKQRNCLFDKVLTFCSAMSKRIKTMSKSQYVIEYWYARGGKRLWNLWNLFRLWVVDVKRCIYVAFSIFIGIRILLCRQDVDNQDKRRRKNWSCDIFWEKFSV